MINMNTFNIDNQYVAGTYSRFPIEIVSGNGAELTDVDNKKYIDLGSGIAVNTFGMADSSWIDAVTNQLKMFQHTSNLYYSRPCAELAKLLCERTGMKKVFFGNSGAEANECAIKVARKYAAQKKGEDFYTIITLKNSFHGRTLTTLAATGQDVFHSQFLPLTPGFVHVEANNIADLREKVKQNKVAGIMFECVQGEGGVLPLEADFVAEMRKISDENDILLIADEVQTGNGRCGKLYAYMNYGIKPDVFTTAKGLGGGLPIGACVIGEKAENVLSSSDHGSTFGGNPVVCAGAINILSRIDDELLESVREKSKFIFDNLTGANGILSVTGMGLMIGIETVKNASDIIAECMKNGVLVIKAKNKVRLLPPLNITMQQLEFAVNVIKEACKIN